MRLIIGAGLTGLAAGLGSKLSGCEHFEILEKNQTVGGLAASIRLNGWTFDHTGHFLHLKNHNLRNFLEQIVKMRVVRRQAAVLYDNKFIPYPFQMNLWYVDLNERIDMVMGAIQAHVSSFVISSYQDWLISSVGKPIAERFLLPYNQKLYNIDLSELLPEQGGEFIPKPDLRQILMGAMSSDGNSMGYNATFLYPQHGGIQAIPDALGQLIQSHIHFESKVIEVNATTRSVICESGESFTYDPPLISTIPLPLLINMLQFDDKSTLVKLKSLSSVLLATQILTFNIGIKGELAIPWHWIYVPDKKFPFYRVGSQSNVSSSTVPDGCSSLWIEICTGIGSQPNHVEVWPFGKTIIEAIDSLQWLKPGSSIELINVDHVWPGYVLFTRKGQEAKHEILVTLERLGIRCCGRYGRWAYMSMEQCLLDGLESVGYQSENIEMANKLVPCDLTSGRDI